jgi:acetyltransferase-like isoleucine patch superfamily enzyme
MLLVNYLKTFLQKQRYSKSVSLLSIWDKYTKFPKAVYIAQGVRLGYASIGKYSRIRQFSTIYHTEMGNYTAIGKNARIGIGRHPNNLLSTNLIFYKKNPIRNDWRRPIEFQEYLPNKIGNDVWIGENVSIVGGITIGDGAIVATRAVVTKDVPPYAIVAGVPAKVVKYRFDEETIKSLLKVRWWDLPDEIIKKKLAAFTIFNISKEEIENYFLVYSIKKT